MSLIDTAQKIARVTNSDTVIMPPFSAAESKILAFPDTLRAQPLPFVLLTAQGKTSSPAISLPIPPGLTIGDGMSYSSINLGIIGTIMAETMTQMGKQTSLAGVVGAGVGGMVGSVINKAGQLNAAATASILARKFGFETVADTVDFSQKQVIAPNTNTTFQNSNIRSYSFAFKLVSRSKKEAETIKRIVDSLRENMYPEGKDVVLSYPPIWNISFYDRDGVVNPYLPKIFDSYLTGMTATFNASTNIFHEDGSPVETDVSLSFQETRALTKMDIQKLERGETRTTESV
jgi:hypothetical protein